MQKIVVTAASICLCVCLGSRGEVQTCLASDCDFLTANMAKERGLIKRRALLRQAVKSFILIYIFFDAAFKRFRNNQRN